MNVELETIRTRLHEANCFEQIGWNKPNINEVNLKKRLNFAWAFVNYSKEFRHKVLWTDESRFEVRRDTRQKSGVWRQPNTTFKLKTVKDTVKFN